MNLTIIKITCLDLQVGQLSGTPGQSVFKDPEGECSSALGIAVMKDNPHTAPSPSNSPTISSQLRNGLVTQDWQDQVADLGRQGMKPQASKVKIKVCQSSWVRLGQPLGAGQPDSKPTRPSRGSLRRQLHIEASLQRGEWAITWWEFKTPFLLG